MAKHPESNGRPQMKSVTSGVDVTLWQIARTIKEARAKGQQLTPAKLTHILEILSFLSGSDTELELATFAGMSLYQLKKYISL